MGVSSKTLLTFLLLVCLSIKNHKLDSKQFLSLLHTCTFVARHSCACIPQEKQSKDYIVYRVVSAHVPAVQAETEELARKVESLNAENATLKSEINRLTESSEKMRVENATLRVLFNILFLITHALRCYFVMLSVILFLTQGKLKNAQLGQTQEITLKIIDSQRATPVSTENLLSRVNNSGSNDRTVEDENGFCENKPNSGAKLHQLLDTSPRADAVAAG